MRRGHCVYVLRMADSSFRKVGMSSSDLMKRLQSIQIGCPQKLQFQLIVSCPTRADSEQLEAVCLWEMNQRTTVMCQGEWSHVEVSDGEFNRLLFAIASRLGIAFEVVFERGVVC